MARHRYIVPTRCDATAVAYDDASGYRVCATHAYELQGHPHTLSDCGRCDYPMDGLGAAPMSKKPTACKWCKSATESDYCGAKCRAAHMSWLCPASV